MHLILGLDTKPPGKKENYWWSLLWPESAVCELSSSKTFWESLSKKPKQKKDRISKGEGGEIAGFF